MVQYRKVGEILLEKGVISKTQLAKAIKMQAKTSMRFGEILTAMGAASEEDIARCLADQYDYPLADLAGITPDRDAVELLEQGFAISHLVLPVHVSASEFECVVSDPVDIATTDLVAMNTHKRPLLSLAAPTPLLKAILVAYGLPPLEMVVSRASLDAEPSPTVKRRAGRKIDPQRDREALLAFLGTIPAPTVHRSLWSRLVG